MELKLKKVTIDELGGDMRMLLGLSGKPFFFLWYRGEVFMKKGMKGASKTAAALREMWGYERLGDDASNEVMDRLYDTIAEASGAEAAKQAWDAWYKCVKEVRRKKGDAAASKWYAEVYQQIPLEDWDTMYENGYDDDFLLGLQRAFYDAREGNEQQFNWRGESHTRTVFAYAFLKGMEAAAAKAEQEVQA